MQNLCLPAEGDTADGEPDVPAAMVRGVDFKRAEVQIVGAGVSVANGRPVETFATCADQGVARVDDAAPDKHQRCLHNSIRIS